MDKRHIGYAVKLLNRRLDQVLSNIPAIRENNSLTGIQTWALNYLIRNDTRDVFQKDVEAELKIRRSTATELLKAMERGGLIRHGDPQTAGRADRADGRKNDGRLHAGRSGAIFFVC